MTPRREMAVTVGVLGLAAGVVLMAAGQPRVSIGGAGSTMTGADTPAATALGLVALAGAGALLLVRGWGRVAIGILLVAVGVGIVLAMLASPDDFGWFAYGSPSPPPVRLSAWGWLGLAGGVLVTGAAAVTTWRGRRWPAPRRRYDPAGAAAGAANPPKDAWDALDRGEDPTV